MKQLSRSSGIRVAKRDQVLYEDLKKRLLWDKSCAITTYLKTLDGEVRRKPSVEGMIC